MSPREILALESPMDRSIEASTFVINKLQVVGYDGLLEVERVIDDVMVYAYKLDQGGLSTTLLWDPPEYRDACISHIELIGARELAAFLRRAAGLVDEADGRRTGPTVGDLADAVGRAVLEGLERELEALAPPGTIEEHLGLWLLTQRDAWMGE